MTLEQCLVKSLTTRGFGEGLALEIMAAFRAKGIVNAEKLDAEAETMDISSVLIIWNTLMDMSISEMIRSLRIKNPNKGTLLCLT